MKQNFHIFFFCSRPVDRTDRPTKVSNKLYQSIDHSIYDSQKTKKNEEEISSTLFNDKSQFTFGSKKPGGFFWKKTEMAKTFAHTWTEFFHSIPPISIFHSHMSPIMEKKENFFFRSNETTSLHTHTHVVKKNEGPENSTIWNRKKKENLWFSSPCSCVQKKKKLSFRGLDWKRKRKKFFFLGKLYCFVFREKNERTRLEFFFLFFFIEI